MFKEAKIKELKSFFDNHVWEFQTIKEASPEKTMSANILTHYWKLNPDVTRRAKARLIVRGYTETSASLEQYLFCSTSATAEPNQPPFFPEQEYKPTSWEQLKHLLSVRNVIIITCQTPGGSLNPPPPENNEPYSVVGKLCPHKQFVSKQTWRGWDEGRRKKTLFYRPPSFPLLFFRMVDCGIFWCGTHHEYIEANVFF